jgi:acyl carrier protein
VSESIEARVMDAVVRSQSLEPGRVTPATTFEELDMSSLDALALVNELEEQFNVAIPNEEAMGLRSVGEAIDCIRRLAT